MVFHWSLSDSKSPQISRILLRILAVLSNAVIWIVFHRPPTSKSSRPFNNPLVIVPKARITIGPIVTLIFHSFFNSLTRSRYLSFFSHSFSFILWSTETAKSTILQILFFFFLLIIIRSGLLAKIRWSVCMSRSHKSLCVSFSRTGAGLLVWSNLNILHISQRITLPTRPCLALYSLCANLLHSLIIWLVVSSLSPHSLHFIIIIIIINIIIIIHYSFLHQRKLMVFHWKLSDNKCPKVSRNLLGILAVFNNTVVWDGLHSAANFQIFQAFW